MRSAKQSIPGSTATPAVPGEPELLKVGDLANDTLHKRVGRIMATGTTPGSKGRWWLRPPSGGLEWDVERDHLQPITDDLGATS